MTSNAGYLSFGWFSVYVAVIVMCADAACRLFRAERPAQIIFRVLTVMTVPLAVANLLLCYWLNGLFEGPFAK